MKPGIDHGISQGNPLHLPRLGEAGRGLNTSGADLDNLYLYNGKELQKEFGLEWYDYGFRFYDPLIGRFTTVDPKTEKFPWQGSYCYANNNPVKFIDYLGMNADWYENEDGSLQYDKNVKSQADLKEGQTYVGQTATGLDAQGNTVYGDQYGNTHNSVSLNEVSVTASPAYNDGLAYALFGELASGKLDAGNYGPATEIPTPDYIVVSGSATAILGGGGGVDLNIVYVKGDGLAVNGSFRVGPGVDFSAGGSVTIGNYTGTDKPTIQSTSGANIYQNMNVGPISITTQQDVSKNKFGKAQIGQNWNYISVGIGVGLKSFPTVTGSAGSSVTSNPWFYLNKSK